MEPGIVYSLAKVLEADKEGDRELFFRGELRRKITTFMNMHEFAKRAEAARLAEEERVRHEIVGACVGPEPAEEPLEEDPPGDSHEGQSALKVYTQIKKRSECVSTCEDKNSPGDDNSGWMPTMPNMFGGGTASGESKAGNEVDSATTSFVEVESLFTLRQNKADRQVDGKNDAERAERVEHVRHVSGC